MNIHQLIEFMAIAENLKNNTRHSWTSTGRHESVADHSWRLAILAYFSKDEFPQVDINKVVLMCLFHDLGEAITGDIPAFEKTELDEIHENDKVMELISGIPEPYGSELISLFAEMNGLMTLESKLYKALDKMEAIIQHNEADISTWLPLEYTTNITYGEAEVSFSDYTRELKSILNDRTVSKIDQHKKPVECTICQDSADFNPDGLVFSPVEVT